MSRTAPLPPSALLNTAPTAGPYVPRYDSKWGVATVHQAVNGRTLASITSGGTRRYADAQLMAASWSLAEALDAILDTDLIPKLPDHLVTKAEAALKTAGWDPEGSRREVTLHGNRTDP